MNKIFRFRFRAVNKDIFNAIKNGSEAPPTELAELHFILFSVFCPVALAITIVTS